VRKPGPPRGAHSRPVNSRRERHGPLLCTLNRRSAPYYRISQLSHESAEDLHAGIASEDGRSTIADLANFAAGGAILLIAEEDE
jgi:hypothetical protein